MLCKVYFSDCAEVGTTFQEFEDYFLEEESFLIIFGSTVEQCKLACINHDETNGPCLSANYDASKGACHLFYRFEPSSNMSFINGNTAHTYLQRDCSCKRGDGQCTGMYYVIGQSVKALLGIQCVVLLQQNLQKWYKFPR